MIKDREALEPPSRTITRAAIAHERLVSGTGYDRCGSHVAFDQRQLCGSPTRASVNGWYLEMWETAA